MRISVGPHGQPPTMLVKLWTIAKIAMRAIFHEMSSTSPRPVAPSSIKERQTILSRSAICALASPHSPANIIGVAQLMAQQLQTAGISQSHPARPHIRQPRMADLAADNRLAHETHPNPSTHSPRHPSTLTVLGEYHAPSVNTARIQASGCVYFH